MQISIVGAKGKLGTHLTKTLENAGYEVIKIDVMDSLDLVKNSNLIIDCSHHTVSLSCMKVAKKYSIPLLILTTGHTQKEKEKILRLSKKTSVEFCSNLTCGIQEIRYFIDNILKTNSLIDAHIFEEHAKTKLDSPSGTAESLKSLIKDKSNIIPSVLSSRVISSCGKHTVILEFENEKITISHEVTNYNAFGEGLLKKLSSTGYMQKTLSTPHARENNEEN